MEDAKTRNREAKKELMRSFFYGFKEPSKVVVEKAIGNYWHEFIKGSGDLVKSLITEKGDNVTVLLYKAPKGMIFDAHFHEPQIEYVSVLYGEAKIELFTTEGKIVKQHIGKGDTFSFPNYEDHKFYFLEDTYLQITYYPEFPKAKWTATKSENLV